MDDEERQIAIEQVNAIRDRAQVLQRRLDSVAVAGTVANDDLRAIDARCRALRGILGAKDWE
jgi:hypothetical protein